MIIATPLECDVPPADLTSHSEVYKAAYREIRCAAALLSHAVPAA
jgi:hypothetical protein